MPNKPSLLYVSPVLPAPSGNGLAMRAYTMMRALAGRHDVSLLWPGDPATLAEADEIAAVGVTRTAWFRGGSPNAASSYDGERFDVVHVFRLRMAPLAEPWMRSAGKCWLDLDEVESSLARRLARLRGVEDEAAAQTLETAERDALQTFDRVFVSSRLEAERLPAQANALHVAPNVLPRVPDSLPPPASGNVTRIAFVGTLGYFPNEDAVTWFATEVLPRIRAATRREVEFVVAGSGGASLQQGLSGASGVRFLGHIPDLAPVYRDANVVVAPLRAGGGTRIKVLEAFAFGRPVVATPVGAEGLGAAHRVHVLVGESVPELARYCLDAVEDLALAARLVASGRSLLLRRYTAEALHAALASIETVAPA